MAEQTTIQEMTYSHPLTKDNMREYNFTNLEVFALMNSMQHLPLEEQLAFEQQYKISYSDIYTRLENGIAKHL
jgi:hypothetical protein